MRSLIAFGIYLAAFALLTACSPESTEVRALQPYQEPAKPAIPQYKDIPAQSFQWITEDGGQSQLSFNPRVDILFVADNSESMKSAQENLMKNMDRFTAGITRNKMIDYHIGVISTWDSSERYAKTKKDDYKMGDLRFAKDLSGKAIDKRFVANSDAGKLLVAQTIKIGVAPYSEGGPEVEEFFAPLAAAIENTGRGAVNEDFFRDDAQLVVILLTDADDSTSHMTPDAMAKMLVNFKGGNKNKVSVYGVLVRAQDSDQNKDWALRIHPTYHPECFDGLPKNPKNNGKCKGFGPERLEEFVLLANSDAGTPEKIREKYIMGITSPSFGADLTKIGDTITIKTLEKEILLSQRPRVSDKNELMVRVKYGTEKQLAAGKGQLIAQKQNGGWLYDPENNSVRISGNVQYDYQEGARFSVELIPATIKQ